MIASKSRVLPDGASITATELEGASDLIRFLHAYYQGYDKAAESISNTSLLDYDAVHILSLAELV